MSGRGPLKGVSGNPGGKPAGFREFTELARKMTPAALRRVEKLAESHPDAAIRLAADKVILERGWGKPVTPIAVNAESMGQPQFVIRTPAPIATAQDWERTVEMERSEYEARALPAPQATAASPIEQQPVTIVQPVVVIEDEEAEFTAPPGGFTAPG